MITPTIKCVKCSELIFGMPKNTKKAVTCQQCQWDENIYRKFQRVPIGAQGIGNYFVLRPLNKTNVAI